MRKLAGWSLARAARLARVSVTTLRMYEASTDAVTTAPRSRLEALRLGLAIALGVEDAAA